MVVDIHRCRFVDYQPHTITSLSFSHKSTKKFSSQDLRLAVARNNGDIEIWNPKNKWIHETTLYGGKDRSIEGLVWSTRENEEPRLFSIGGSTVITEWNLITGKPLKHFDCNAAIIWSISINESQDKIAVGCDDGTIVVVDISGGPGSIEHYAFLQRQESRILSVVWKNDDYIIGGCADGRIRVWNFGGDFQIHKYSLISTMRVDKSKTESTLVWSVLYLPIQNQIISGDSTGSIKIWDFTHFTLLQSFKVHAADILTLTTDFNNESIFSAGVDRKIFKLQLIDSNNNNSNSNKKQLKWNIVSNRLFHSNDVRSITSYESKNYNFLISGGVEKSIVVSSLKSFTDGQYRKISFIPQEEHVVMNKSQNLIILWQEQTIKIWKLLKRKIVEESDEEEDDQEDEEMKDVEDVEDKDDDFLIGNYKDSYELVSKLTLADEDNITSVAISQDGSKLAVGRLSTTKLFNLSNKPNSNKLKINKINHPELNSKGSKFLLFNDSSSLILSTPENEIFKISLDEEDEQSIIEYELSDLPKNKSKLTYIENINNLKLTSNNSKLIVSRISGAIDIIDLESSSSTNESIQSKPFLRLSSFINKLEITLQNTLIVLTQENKIYEFELNFDGLNSSAHLTNWSKINSEFLPKQFINQQEIAHGCFLDKTDNYKIWIYGSNWISFFQLNQNIPINNSKKDAKKRNRQGHQIGLNNEFDDMDYEFEESDVEEQDFENDGLNYQDRLIERADFIKELNNDENNGNNKDGIPFGITKKYKSILFANCLNNGELIIIERPSSLLPKTPAFKLNQIKV
ncbi:putative WD repeat-containing protein [Wickerhamomyces ciferrii]|uniref:WD repeat-containing protein n=1 Tax=Wickerhamomyces ciferrii (strain ATCC 14091 / BCRC 22168 / CBS 111 / JCM 3599 / NBRC 0793 / NRRL Y-1031 F-60-10) TaxID=1206466 RepID=K0KQS4_WICCF|nr:putative WD repeat-containing protein [Wickerhamomyces ciferrii]CCH45436.1 putative WD repeat-containing protein [Wickerhamomyces ciferrii]